MIDRELIREWANKARGLAHQDLLCEMARVGYFFDNKYEVYIHTNDPGDEPHFHVRDVGTQGDEFHTCVKIKEAMYFRHPGKMDVMNSHMKKNLVDFLNATPPKKKNVSFSSNWEKVIYEWNENNSNMQVDEEQVMPDYTQIIDNLKPRAGQEHQ